MQILVLVLFVLVAAAAGGGLGLMLKPKSAEAEAPSAGATSDGAEGHAEIPVERTAQRPAQGREYWRIGRQFIVPVVEGRETRALMLFDLAVDVPAESSALMTSVEPRLRDAFLRELFEMSHTGAFLGTYTDERTMDELREKLTDAAKRHLGDMARQVLILDAVRQEL